MNLQRIGNKLFHCKKIHIQVAMISNDCLFVQEWPLQQSQLKSKQLMQTERKRDFSKDLQIFLAGVSVKVQACVM